MAQPPTRKVGFGHVWNISVMHFFFYKDVAMLGKLMWSSFITPGILFKGTLIGTGCQAVKHSSKLGKVTKSSKTFDAIGKHWKTLQKLQTIFSIFICFLFFFLITICFHFFHIYSYFFLICSNVFKGFLILGVRSFQNISNHLKPSQNSQKILVFLGMTWNVLE